MKLQRITLLSSVGICLAMVTACGGGTANARPAATVTATTTVTASPLLVDSDGDGVISTHDTDDGDPEIGIRSAQPEAGSAETAPFKSGDYEALSQREFKKLIKNPDNYLGRKYLLYGNVVQFDSSTGTDAFHANLHYARKSGDESYEMDDRAHIVGTEEMLEDIVTDDMVQLWLICTGSLTYETPIGGSNTIPTFSVEKVKVYGSSE